MRIVDQMVENTGKKLIIGISEMHQNDKKKPLSRSRKSTYIKWLKKSAQIQ